VSQPNFRATVILEALIAPSEDPAKVAKALGKVVGGPPGEMVDPSSARLFTDDPKTLIRIRDQLRDRHVRAAARKQMLRNARGHLTTLMLNRQAAAAGVVALCGSAEESPLGPIYMMLESPTLDAVVDWLTAYSG
jgi:predicted RNA binding protein with dsRBD fold (UPF0201 family)